VSQAGLVNNAVDGLAWAILPQLFASEGLSVGAIGVLAALYPGVWCVGQLFTGAWSDRVGRKPLIVAGMLVQGLALALMAVTDGFGLWAAGAVLIGIGTALAYPTLIAAVGDVAHPNWRATAVGVYRLWRDCGSPVHAISLSRDMLGRRACDAAASATCRSGRQRPRAIWLPRRCLALSSVATSVRGRLPIRWP
jgi:MFS family permease